MKRFWERGFMLVVLALAAVMFAGCSALESKAVAIGSGVDAMKLETSGSVSSGTILPNIIVGGAVNSICTAPIVKEGETAQPSYSKVRRNSFFGSLFGINDTTETISYIGVPGETAADTAARASALAGLSTTDTPEGN